jgi:hypothetical protein
MNSAEKAGSPEFSSRRELSLERAQGLIWKGFELSQGSNQALTRMWTWVHRHYPLYKASDAMASQLLATLQPAFERLLVKGTNNPGIHTDTTSFKEKFSPMIVEKSSESNIYFFINTLNFQNGQDDFAKFSDEELEFFILNKQLDSDYKFLITQNGRPGDPSKKDIWDSNICKFILSKRPASTGYQEYDLMWQAMGAHKENFLQMHKIQIMEIIAIYNKYHSDNQIELPIS